MPASIDINKLPAIDGMQFACILDGSGSAKLVGWSEVESWKKSDGPLWVHFDHEEPRVESWLREKAGFSEPTIDALLAKETRPRVFRGRRGVVAILRGVNTNPGSQPEDLVAMRMWSDGDRVITLRQHKLLTPRDILAQLVEDESGPNTVPELYGRLIARLTERMAGTVSAFEDNLDELESNLAGMDLTVTRRTLSDIRQNAVLLRRYMAPQREALNSLLIEPPKWMSDLDRMHLRETADHLTRYVEELDAARERSLVIKDDITNQLAESTNKTLYVLAIISAIFLPLGFLTGLLGINVGGMPGVENEFAFWIACGLMAIVLVIEIILFRKLKWL